MAEEGERRVPDVAGMVEVMLQEPPPEPPPPAVVAPTAPPEGGSPPEPVAPKAKAKRDARPLPRMDEHPMCWSPALRDEAQNAGLKIVWRRSARGLVPSAFCVEDMVGRWVQIASGDSLRTAINNSREFLPRPPKERAALEQGSARPGPVESGRFGYQRLVSERAEQHDPDGLEALRQAQREMPR